MAKSNGIPVKYDPKLPPAQQRYEVILSHILDPENSPIPEKFRERFNRIKSAALMLDDLHPANVLPRLTAKYDITRKTAREDVKPAQELFKSKHHPKMSISTLIHQKMVDFCRINAQYYAYYKRITNAIF